MVDQKINLSFSMDEIFDFIPDLISEITSYNLIPQEITDNFKDKAFSLVFECDNEKYTVISKNISDITTTKGDLEDPMVRVHMTMEDLQNLIKIDNAYLFFRKRNGSRKENIAKIDTNKISSLYNSVASLKGKVAFKLINKDDTTSLINFTLNNHSFYNLRLM